MYHDQVIAIVEHIESLYEHISPEDWSRIVKILAERADI